MVPGRRSGTNLIKEITMKLSTNTLTVLKNFSEINNGLHFKKGSSISTWHPGKFVIAEASLTDSLPKDFTVFDLNKFLSITSLFEEPDFDFQENRVVVSSSNRSVNYLYCEPTLVLDPGDKVKKYRTEAVKGSVAQASINKDDLKSLKQAASILGLPDISIQGKSDKIVFTAKDSGNSSSDTFKVEIDADIKEDFDCILKVSHFKLLDGEYELICHPKMAYFKNKNVSVEYWIAFQSQD